MHHIFVASGSEQKGPYSEAEIRAKITAGTITGDTLVWWDGLPEWTAVAKTPLAPSPASPAPAPSAKPEPSSAPEPSVTPAASATPAPVATPAPTPSAAPAPTPSVAPVPAPTVTPSPAVTPAPSVAAAPSVEPAPAPIVAPAPIASAPVVAATLPASVGESKTSTLALISLITALVGFFCGLVSVAAVVTGHLARAEIKKNPELTGGGMALAGLIIGYVWIAVSVISILAYITLLGLAIHQGMAQDQGNLLPNTAPATPGN